MLEEMLPLIRGRFTKVLFVPCVSGWTAIYDNSVGGTDPSKIHVLAGKLNCEGIRVVSVPEGGDDFPARMWELYLGAEQNRSIAVHYDGYKWGFDQSGVPLPFEDIAAYQLKPIKKRFGHDTLVAYLAHLGAAPFDDNFFLANQKALMVTEEQI